MTKDGPIAVLIVLILLFGTIAFAMVYEPEDEEGTGGGGGLTVQSASNAFASSGKAWQISSAAVHANLADGYTGNDPYILDVRGAADYEITGEGPMLFGEIPHRTLSKSLVDSKS